MEDDAGDSSPSKRRIAIRILKVALPMYPQVLLGLCSNLWGGMLVGRYDATAELAAYGVGVVLTQQTGFSMIWGLSNSLSTMSSQAYGAQAYQQVGLNLQRAVLIAFLLIDLPLACVFFNAHELLLVCGQPAEVVSIVGQIARIRVPGLFFATLSACMGKTLAAMELSKYVFVMDVATMCTNVTLSFLLVPHFGAKGQAMASVTADGVAAAVIWILAFRNAEFRQCWPGMRREAFQRWCGFLRVGLPSVLLLGLEIWVWDAQTIIAGYISPVAQATQSVVPQFTCLMYAVGTAMGNGSAAIVGNLLGEGQHKAARRAAVVTFLMTFVAMVVEFAIFLLLQAQIPHLFTDDPTLLMSISALLPFCICFSFLDGHQSALTGIFLGLGWQNVATPLIFVAYWVLGVPLGICLAFGYLNAKPSDLEGLWTGMLVGVCCHTLAYMVALLCVNWKRASETARERALQETHDQTNSLSAIGTSLVEVEN